MPETKRDTSERWPKYWAGAIETASREALRAHQERKLRPLVAWLYERCRYWRDVFDREGAKPGDIRALEDLARLPYVSKKLYGANMDANPPYGDFLCYPEEEIHRMGAIVYRTTGTTGRQRCFINTHEGFQLFGDQGIRNMWQAGLRPGDSVMATFPMSLWGAAWGFYYASRKANITFLPGGPPYDTATRLDLIAEYRPSAIVTTPSYALVLAAAARERGVDLTRCGIRTVIISGEPYPPSRRRKIEEEWGVPRRAIEFAGITEGGPLYQGCECEEQAGMHLYEDMAIFEIVEIGGTRPVGPGELGELVLTTLDQRVMGVSFHYRSGDIVTYTDAPCGCGRTLRRIDGIRGRTDDMVKIRGINIFASAIEEMIRQVPALSDDFMLVIDRQGEMDQVTVEVEPAEGVESHQHATLRLRLEELLRRQLTIRIPVKIVGRKSLPRFELKARRWKDNRPRS